MRSSTFGTTLKFCGLVSRCCRIFDTCHTWFKSAGFNCLRSCIFHAVNLWIIFGTWKMRRFKVMKMFWMDFWSTSLTTKRLFFDMGFKTLIIKCWKEKYKKNFSNILRQYCIRTLPTANTMKSMIMSTSQCELLQKVSRSIGKVCEGIVEMASQLIESTSITRYISQDILDLILFLLQEMYLLLSDLLSTVS